jgi:hypothetical protein
MMIINHIYGCLLCLSFFHEAKENFGDAIRRYDTL